MKVFVTSDTHFSHFNIIRYCNRPFLTIDEMNAAIIKKWNETVEKDDIVIFCGDFCFAKKSIAAEATAHFAAALNGHKIIVKGNHDYKKLRYTELGFEYECYQTLVIGRYMFEHKPDYPTDRTNIVHRYYGHMHNRSIEGLPNATNVCQDANNFQPIDITSIFNEDELKKLQILIKNN